VYKTRAKAVYIFDFRFSTTFDLGKGGLWKLTNQPEDCRFQVVTKACPSRDVVTKSADRPFFLSVTLGRNDRMIPSLREERDQSPKEIQNQKCEWKFLPVANLEAEANMSKAQTAPT
jgi:hypothetical protein